MAVEFRIANPQTQLPARGGTRCPVFAVRLAARAAPPKPNNPSLLHRRTRGQGVPGKERRGRQHIDDQGGRKSRSHQLVAGAVEVLGHVAEGCRRACRREAPASGRAPEDKVSLSDFSARSRYPGEKGGLLSRKRRGSGPRAVGWRRSSRRGRAARRARTGRARGDGLCPAPGRRPAPRAPGGRGSSPVRAGPDGGRRRPAGARGAPSAKPRSTRCQTSSDGPPWSTP